MKKILLFISLLFLFTPLTSSSGELKIPWVSDSFSTKQVVVDWFVSDDGTIIAPIAEMKENRTELWSYRNRSGNLEVEKDILLWEEKEISISQARIYESNEGESVLMLNIVGGMEPGLYFYDMAKDAGKKISKAFFASIKNPSFSGIKSWESDSEGDFIKVIMKDSVTRQVMLYSMHMNTGEITSSAMYETDRQIDIPGILCGKGFAYVFWKEKEKSDLCRLVIGKVGDSDFEILSDESFGYYSFFSKQSAEHISDSFTSQLKSGFVAHINNRGELQLIGQRINQNFSLVPCQVDLVRIVLSGNSQSIDTVHSLEPMGLVVNPRIIGNEAGQPAVLWIYEKGWTTPRRNAVMRSDLYEPFKTEQISRSTRALAYPISSTEGGEKEKYIWIQEEPESEDKRIASYLREPRTGSIDSLLYYQGNPIETASSLVISFLAVSVHSMFSATILNFPLLFLIFIITAVLFRFFPSSLSGGTESLLFALLFLYSSLFSLKPLSFVSLSCHPLAYFAAVSLGIIMITGRRFLSGKREIESRFQILFRVWTFGFLLSFILEAGQVIKAINLFGIYSPLS